jgi:hypothetical protein
MNTVRTLTDREIDFVSGALMKPLPKPALPTLVNINVDPIISIPVLSFNGVGNTNVTGNQNIGNGSFRF